MLNKIREGHWPIFFLSSFSSIANLFLPIILTRILLPEQIGTYKIFFLYFAALPFIFFTGGPVHSVYYWVGKDEGKYQYLQQSYLLSLILSSLILLIGLPLIIPFSNYIELPWQGTLFLLIAAFVSVPASFYNENNIALGKTLKGSLYSVFFETLKVISFITIAKLYQDIQLIFISYAIVLSLKFFVTLYLGGKENLIKFTVDKAKIKEIFNYCLPISLAGLVTFFIDKIDQFVLAGQLAKDEFAFYSMGCLIIPPLYLLEMSVSKVLVPKLSKAHNENDNNSIAYFKKAISDVGFLIIPAVFGLFFFAKPITRLLYTDQFIESTIYLKIFAISYLFFLIPYDAVPRATGHTKWIFKLTLAIAPLSLLGVILSSKFSTAQNVLIVAITFKAITRLSGLVYSCKLMNWKIIDTIPIKKLSVFTIFSLILTFLCSLIESKFESDINWFLFCAPIFAILYLGALYIPHKKGLLHE